MFDSYIMSINPHEIKCPETLVDDFCEACGINPDELYQKSVTGRPIKTKEITLIRQALAFYFSCRTKLKLNNISWLIAGSNDHTLAIYCRDKARDLYHSSDEDFLKYYKILINCSFKQTV